MRIPAIITAGDSYSWTDIAFRRADGSTVSSAGGWTLTYALRGPIVGGNVNLVGVAQGTGWLVTLTAAQSVALNPTPASSTWYWQAVAAFSGARATAGDGTLVVKANVAGLDAANIYDGRSQAEQTLAAIEKEISARITGGVSVEYTIGTRSLKREPTTALMALRSQYRLIVSRERKGQALANGLGNSGRMGVRFK